MTRLLLLCNLHAVHYALICLRASHGCNPICIRLHLYGVQWWANPKSNLVVKSQIVQ